MDGGDDPTKFTSLHLLTRHKLAKAEIRKATNAHIVMDIGLGLVGSIGTLLFPVPGAGIVALGASVAAQNTVIYHPLGARLGQIYTASPADLMEMQRHKLPMPTVLNQGIDLAAYFTLEFLLQESAPEIAGALGAGAIPVVGSAIGAWVDYKIASLMTPRIGRMVALFYLNGARWKNNSFKETYQEAKQNAKGGLEDIHHKNPDVRRVMIGKLVIMIRMVSSYMNVEQIRQMFKAQLVPDDLIGDALIEAGL